MKPLKLFKKYWREQLCFKKFNSKELSVMIAKESSLIVKIYFKKTKKNIN